MILQLLAALAVAGGIYEYTQDSGDDSPAKGKVQVQKGTTPGGTPVATVVPVQKAVTTNQANPSLFVPAPKPPGYLPPLIPARAAVPPTAPGDILQLAPIVITPSGGSSILVQTNSDVQTALNTLGVASPPLVVDGRIGPLTQSALRAFQSSHGLTVDGVAGPQTKTALTQALSVVASPNAAIGQSPQVLSATLQSAAATVPIVSNTDVQHVLNLLGATPVLTEDGNLGPLSVAAIKAFQIVHGLLPDGIAGPATKTAMQLALGAPAQGPTASDTAATGSIPGLGLISLHGESWDLDARARNALRTREDNNYHPDRKSYWLPAEAVPGFVNESELGMRFSEARQKMMRDDGSSVPFGADTDFGAVAPPPPPSISHNPLLPPTPASLIHTALALPPPPPTSHYIAPPVLSAPPLPPTSHYIAPPILPGALPPPPPSSSAYAPPPPPSSVYAPPPPPMGVAPPPPPPLSFQPSVPWQPSQSWEHPWNRRFPFENRQQGNPMWRAERLAQEQAYIASQNQNLGGSGPVYDSVQDVDPSQQIAAAAIAPDPSQMSAPTVVSATPNVPADQSVDPVLDQAIADTATADAQSGAIDPTTGASASVLAAGFEDDCEIGYSSGRGGDFRHMGGTFGFGGSGHSGHSGRSSRHGGSGHHRHHPPQSPPPPPPSDDGSDDMGLDYEFAGFPAYEFSFTQDFLAAAARNAAQGHGRGQSQYAPPSPSQMNFYAAAARNAALGYGRGQSMYAAPLPGQYPYQGAQDPGPGMNYPHHHHHHDMDNDAGGYDDGSYDDGMGY